MQGYKSKFWNPEEKKTNEINIQYEEEMNENEIELRPSNITLERKLTDPFIANNLNEFQENVKKEILQNNKKIGF